MRFSKKKVSAWKSHVAPTSVRNAVGSFAKRSGTIDLSVLRRFSRGPAFLSSEVLTISAVSVKVVVMGGPGRPLPVPLSECQVNEIDSIYRNSIRSIVRIMISLNR